MQQSDDLIAILTRQAAIARVEMANAPQDGRVSWAAITPGTAAPVALALRAVPDIAALEGLWYVLPNECGSIDFKSVALFLLDRAQRVPAQTIIADLLRLAVERTIWQNEVRLLVGVKPTRVIDLGDGFSVTPPEKTPAHENMPGLFSEKNQPRHGWGGPPTAALVRRLSNDLALQAPPEPNSLPLSMRPSSEADWQAALSALALASDASPQLRQNYLVIENPGWIGMRSNSLGSSESFPVPETGATFLHEDRVAGLFQKLRPANKSIDLAISRLVSSRRRLSPEERALDLGTCIEILLMAKSKDNGEISNKIATRAAWLIGRNPDDRMRCYQAARDLYSDRSTAAHMGTLATPGNMEERTAQIDRLRTSDKLCVQIISELLDRGVPKAEDWARIVLNMPDSEPAV